MWMEWGQSGEEWGVTAKECEVSFSGDENGLKLTGDGCVTVSILKATNSCT